MSEVRDRIRLIIDGGLAPELKRAGFRRSSMNFWRPVGEATQVINIQSSRWNSDESGSFTVNIAVDFPRVAQMLPNYLPMPKVPKEYCCLLRTRIGTLMSDGKDHWWTVTSQTDARALGQELAETWPKYILPWLEQHKTVAALIADGQRTIPGVFSRAAASILTGDKDRAAQLIKTEIDDIQSKPLTKFSEHWLTQYRNWAKEQGLQIT